MSRGWQLLVALMALGAAPLRWIYNTGNVDSNPLQSCTTSPDGVAIDSLDALALCLQRFVVPAGAIPADDWWKESGVDTATGDGSGDGASTSTGGDVAGVEAGRGGGDFVPSPQQRRDLAKFVRRMATAPNAVACRKLLLPASLKRVYHPPRLFRDTALGESFCLLLERTRRGRFVVGWGWLLVRLEPREPVMLEEEGKDELGEKGLQRYHQQQQRMEGGGGMAELRWLQPRPQRQPQLLEVAWAWFRGWAWFQRFRSGQAWEEEEEKQVQEEAEIGPGAGSQAALLEAAEGGAALGGAWAPGGRPLRRLHLGAPHPSFEGPVDLQAVALFRRLPSLARSVVVSGKHRAATPADSTCLPGRGYPASDPSHNVDDAFNVISFALLKLEQHELGDDCGAGKAAKAEAAAVAGGRGAQQGELGQRLGLGSAVFLQLHGKAVESCPGSTVFCSGGFGRNATRFYGRGNTVVARLAAALEAAAAAARGEEVESLLGPAAVAGGVGGGRGWVVRMPPGDPGCALVASRNVFGRVVNGVDRAEACDRPAEDDGGNRGEQESLGHDFGGGGDGGGAECFGAFAHVEQAEEARVPSAWRVWVRALRALQGGE